MIIKTIADWLCFASFIISSIGIFYLRGYNKGRRDEARSR